MLDARVVKAAVLTPAGRGAVATIVVWGRDAATRVEPCLIAASGRPLSREPVDRIIFARWGNSLGEELVAIRRDSGSVEIHCHGGIAASAGILHDLRAQQCEIASSDEYMAATLVDPIQQSALAALQQAPTLRTARILLDQYHGAWQREVTTIQAELDAGNAAAALQRLDQLSARAELGRHLTIPYRVVIGGPPNVGKSSLINALVGYERAIVFDQPGTTRDVVRAATSFDGWPVELADTAGLRASDDPLETAGVQRAQQQLASADLIVLVFDLTQPWSAEHAALAAAWPRALIVHNKCDLVDAPTQRLVGLSTSTVTSAGLPQLMASIAARLVPHPPAPGVAVPFDSATIQQVEEWREQLASPPQRFLPGLFELC